MLKYLQTRELQARNWKGRRAGKDVRDIVAPRLPSLLHEREFKSLESHDKVFASAWVDDSSFVLGTKDNKLLLWSTESDKRVEIPLPDVPPEKRRLRALQSENCGIHSIAINPSKSLLATGAANPNDAAIFRLPSFEPVAVLSRHDDWIFAASWLTENVLATGSRDSTLKLWSVHEDQQFVEDSLVTRTDHRSKVRDLKYSPQVETLATLSTDATCKIWDPHTMTSIHTLECPDKRELVCMAMEETLVAVGSQRMITFIDSRCGHITKSVLSLDDGWGVRSLSFQDNILTCGGGKGRLSFLDLRTQKYLRVCGIDKHDPLSTTYYHLVGEGFVEHNDVYYEHFHGQRIKHAIYSHCYNNCGTSLLVCGGPLPFGLRGCYVGLW